MEEYHADFVAFFSVFQDKIADDLLQTALKNTLSHFGVSYVSELPEREIQAACTMFVAQVVIVTRS